MVDFDPDVEVDAVLDPVVEQAARSNTGRARSPTAEPARLRRVIRCDRSRSGMARF